MYTTENLLKDLGNFNDYVNALQTIEERLFFEPIAEEKWSIAEIISHISFWDEYIRKEMLPQMKQNAVIESIDIETLNKQAAAYARSGVSQQQILDKQLKQRAQLLSDLKEKDEEEFFASFTMNGEEIDEYSGYPHTIFNYIAAFIWHDNHHKKQMEQFLNENGRAIKS